MRKLQRDWQCEHGHPINGSHCRGSPFAKFGMTLCWCQECLDNVIVKPTFIEVYGQQEVEKEGN
jgi:hypothetical protein